MAAPYDPRKEWTRESAAPVTETLGALFRAALLNAGARTETARKVSR